MYNKDFIPEKEPNADNGIKRTIISLLIALAILGSFFLGFFVKQSTQNDRAKLVDEILSIIEENSKLKGEDLTDEELSELIFQATLLSDPYAVYYSKEEYENLKLTDSGIFEGIGITFEIGSKKIVSIMWNSPAQQGGLQVDDVILEAKLGGVESQEEYSEIDTSDDLTDFIAEIELGDTFTFKVLRKEMVEETLQETIKEIEITKKSFQVSYVLYRDSECEFRPISSNTDEENTDNEKGDQSLKDDTCYIQLTQFEGEATSQFYKAMDYMQKRGKTKLILDLRDNGGGDMQILLKIASKLIYNNGIPTSRICYAEQKENKKDYCTSNNLYEKDVIEDIVILANENTASASEVLIGAMDYDGKHGGGVFTIEENLITTKNSERSKNGVNNFTTYGKGIMQTIYPLTNGGAIKLTTATLYQPDGVTCIHDVGLASNKAENNVLTNEQAYARALQLINPIEIEPII